MEQVHSGICQIGLLHYSPFVTANICKQISKVSSPPSCIQHKVVFFLKKKGNWWPTLKTNDLQFDNFVITGGTVSYDYEQITMNFESNWQ